VDIETLAIAQQKTEDRSLRNEGRIKKLETEHEILHQLATSIAVMAEKMEAMSKSVNSLTDKVEEIENKPAERWDKIVSAVIGTVVGGFVGWLVAGAPGM
jgi:hypothetical protein